MCFMFVSGRNANVFLSLNGSGKATLTSSVSNSFQLKPFVFTWTLVRSIFNSMVTGRIITEFYLCHRHSLPTET